MRENKFFPAVKTCAVAVLFPLIIYLLDILVRFQYLKILDSKGLSNFCISLLYETLFYTFIFWLISLLPRWRKQAVIAFVVIVAFIQLIVYGHYFYFGVLPNNYSINYLFDHFHDTMTLTVESLRKLYLLIFAALTATHFFAASFSLRKIESISKRNGITLGVCFVVFTLFMNNNVRFQPASYSFTPATLFSLKYVLQERFFGEKFLIQNGYIQRKFELKTVGKVKASYNVLLIISESVRGSHLHYNGYDRQTSPFIDSMISVGKVIPFKHHFSNSVSTQFSVPMILSGNYTIEKLNQPYIYDYIKNWTNATTFFFSSQSMRTDNIDLVFNTSLDKFVCQETSGKPKFNDRGINDHDLLPDISAYLDGLKGKKFFGVIQLNNTHYPYNPSKPIYEKFKPCPPASLNRYDNTIYEQDDLLKSYFEMMQKKKLFDSTIIIFTSDHGEGFVEHGHSGHLQTLYNEDIEVPFWIHLPSNFPEEQKKLLLAAAGKTTSHISIFPTLLEVYGLLDSTKLNLYPSGQSLFHLSKDESIPVVGLDMIDTKAIVAGNFKYIYTKKDNIERDELFDMENDPKELVNIWEKASAETQQRFKSLLKNWEAHRTVLTSRNKPI